MIKKAVIAIVLLFVVLVVGFCIVVAMQPAEFKVVRSITVATPPEKVFGHVNDFRKWEAWSPWARIDPSMKVTYSGSESGKGAQYAWTGNDQVGEGKMTITDSRPSDHVAMDLEFIKPFAARNVTEFNLKPEGAGTGVTWSMAGQNNFMMKAFCLVVDMDKMVGEDFEKGLAQLKTVAESQQ